MADDYTDSTADNNDEIDRDALSQPLPNDFDPPFSDPVNPVDDPNADIDARSTELDPTHQARDSASDIDLHQQYDEGLSGASEAAEPSNNDTVVESRSEEDGRITNQG